jgi:glycosyltransferase involved in cell wall biosynthesis
MRHVVSKIPNAKCVVIGDGTLKEETIKEVSSLGIQKSVRFKGWVSQSELPQYYASAAVFACPSYREGSPVSYVEALSCGTPIVVGDIPVSYHLVAEGRGKIVIQSNPIDIAEKIVAQLHASKTSTSAYRHFVKNTYSWDVVSKKFSQVLS